MNIILALDARSFSIETVTYAIAYAKGMRENLVIMSVLDKKDMEDNPHLVTSTHILMSRVKSKAEDEGVEAKTLLATGHPVDTILSEADTIQATAIILGPTTKTVLDKFMIGSVSEGLIKAAKCPVIIVK